MPPITSNTPPAKPTGKDETHTRKTSSAAARTTHEPAVKCPRCDSPNTKFCYYNNYSLTQPRHFCKTCRRYWTKGGALRNVPIGGGCRKNKKLKSCQRLSGDSKDSSGSSDVGGGLKFFQGLSPAMDFQLGGINNTPPSTIFNQYSSFGDLSVNPNFNLESSGINSTPLLGFGFPLSSSSSIKQGQTFNNNTQLGFQEMGSMNVHSSLASSIEDLHWKLQQQRLSTLLGDQDNQKENSNIPSGNIEVPLLIQKPQPILFQNLENSKPDQSCLIGTSRKDGGNGNLSTELFFSNSYAAVGPTPATSSSNNLNDNSSNWSGMQAWTELAQYSSLP